MREEDSNWFAKWEDELPSPEELMPLSQTLITQDLAIAFDIRNSNNTNQTDIINTVVNSPQANSSAEFDSDMGGTRVGGEGGVGIGSGLDEQARTLKRPRLVWTPQLHKRFVDAVAHLGIKNAVPKTIMQLMSVDGLTRENVASHLQKYRLYLKRMQSNNNGAGNGNSPGWLSGSGVDTAMDRLFASAPVPAHFLRPISEHYVPYTPGTMQVHHPQIALQAPMVGHGPQIQQPFRHFRNSPPNEQFEHPFLGRQSQQQQVQRIGTPIHANGNGNSHHGMPTSYVESATAANGRKVLTLFPNGDD
ncbi:hypothetical protein LIER_03915 [Lithospermum erythrorhizon]|uniref:HTH myb-type domain-containing protein n=1 Tax=Lithospermum erythrorhizon TaxID=34254 RepID=A0AAV3NXK3_LITER